MNDNIRIRLKAFDHRILDKSSKDIIDAVKASGAKVKGPIPLPTSKKKMTVLRSPHIDKKSREQFEIQVHKRVFDIINPDSQTIASLMQLDLSSGIGVEIKLGGENNK